MKDLIIDMVAYGLSMVFITTLLAFVVLPIVMYRGDTLGLVATIVMLVGMYSSMIYAISNDIKMYKRHN